MRAGHSRSVDFEGHGGIRLSGVLHSSPDRSLGAIVQAHCFTCSKDYKIQVWLARELAARGFEVLRFDFAGLGASDGDFSETTLATDVEDLEAAFRWLQEKAPGPVSLMGHSMGGVAAVLAASRLDGVAAVVTLGTSIHIGRRISKLLRADYESDLAEKGVTEVRVGKTVYPLSREFLHDLERHSISDALQSTRCPILIVHGTEDSIVPVAEAEALFDVARQPKAFLSVPNGDHLFTADRDLAPRLATLISTWLTMAGGCNR